MKSVVITRHGPPDVLALRDRPAPEPRPEEVRVRVRATALNRADLLQRRGLYDAPPGVPADVPGLEFSGSVELCGREVSGLRLGDRVMGILPGGGYAEQVCVHERLCLPVPDRLDWQQAAAVPEAFLTAFDALFVQAGLRAGESVLINAAASGVGTAASRMALASGAVAIGLSRTEKKRERLTRLGLEHVFDPGRTDLADAVRAAADRDGVDVVVDLVGAAAWASNLDVMRTRGRLVVVGLLGGARVDLDLWTLLRKRLTLVGTVLRSRSLDEKIELTRAFARRMGPLLADGRLEPTVDRSFPLEHAAEAHALMESNANFGKIVLEVSPT